MVGESVRSFRNDGKGSVSSKAARGERENDHDRRKGENQTHGEWYQSANGSREIVEGRFKGSNRTARQTKQNRTEPGIN